MSGGPRRAVRLITRLNIGGPARQANALTRALAPEWHTVLATGVPSAEEGELREPGVEVERVPLVRPLSPVADGRALVAVRRLLARERPDLLHTHMAKAGTIGRVAAASTRGRIRTVHTFHGHVLEGYFAPAVQKAFLTTERWLARRTDVLVAVSDEVRDELLDLGIGQPAQWRVIRLGLDLGAHRRVTEQSGALRARLGIERDVPLVGTIGRLVPIKDHELLLRAFRDVPDAHLAIVGDGELRSALERRVDELDLRDRVHFTGWMTDIPAVMADLDVAVLTSRNEGTPVSLIEAAACGISVVATRVGGVASVVRHDETGVIVPYGNAVAIADALRRLLADPALRARFGAAGRDASRAFDETRLVADVRSLYDELVPAHR